METWRFAFILHHAASLLMQFMNHLGEDRLEVAVVGVIRAPDGIKFIIGDIECSGILMGGLLGGIAVDTTQLLHSHRRAQQTRHYHTIVAATALLHRLAEILPYIMKQFIRLGHKIWIGMCELVYGKVFVALHLYQRALGMKI